MEVVKAYGLHVVLYKEEIMGFFDGLSKKAGELYDSAAEISKSVTEKAGELRDSAAELSKNVTEKAGDLYDSVAESAESTYNFLSSKGGEAAEGIQNMLASKFYETINHFDYDGTLEKLEEAQKTQEKDLSPLIDFVAKLKSFAEEGKKKYGKTND